MPDGSLSVLIRVSIAWRHRGGTSPVIERLAEKAQSYKHNSGFSKRKSFATLRPLRLM
jgi:hypothetical protein